MKDRGLDCFLDEVAEVRYSADGTRRYVLLKNEKGHYSYLAQEILPFDEEEWRYIYENESSLPAMWSTPLGHGNASLFADRVLAEQALVSEGYYKQYFS